MNVKAKDVIAKLPRKFNLPENIEQRSNLPENTRDLDQKDCFVDQNPKSIQKSRLLAMTTGKVIAKLSRKYNLPENIEQRSNLPENTRDLDQKDCFVDKNHSSIRKSRLLAMTMGKVIAKLPRNYNRPENIDQRSNLPKNAWDLEQKDCFVGRNHSSIQESRLLAMTAGKVIAKLPTKYKLSENINQRSNLLNNAWDLDQKDCFVDRNHSSIPILKLLTITIGIALTFSPTLFAQNGGFAGASGKIGFNARGMAMSNAMAATTSQGNYAYYNPAQAALFSEAKQTDFTVGALQFDRVFQTAGVQFQLPPTAGLSFSLMRTGIKNIDGRTQSGYPTGTFDASDYQLRSNFGIRLSEKMNAGIGVNFSLADYHAELENAVSVGVDVGLLYHAGNNLNLAFAVKDLFAQYNWNSQELYALEQARNVVNKFPTRIILGAAFQKEKFTVSADFEIQVFESEVEKNSVFVSDGIPVVITETNIISTHAKQFRLGGSWKAHERFTLRGGWQLPDASDTKSWATSTGFSVHLPFDVFSPSIDYAFVLEPYRISNMHVFSLRLNL